ncbi:MAG: polysaccharide deacetylase family protein [Halodesulfurarchaeum sp.]|nr:polysaccharide deacetylase family protein [Halodesulfurarchaeum sp.]
MTEPRRAVLSVDFERFDHTPAYRQARGSLSDSAVGLSGAAWLREAFDAAGTTTTWFTVGEVVADHPDAVEKLVAAGHEVGSHTYTHRLLTELDATERREELERSRAILEETTGETVSGFRAPAFDFGAGHFEALETAGYEYDSSVVASRTIPGWYGGEYELTRPAPATTVDSAAPETIAELPVSVMPGLRLPLTGTWMRFFGPRYTISGMKLLARRGITPVLYVHPWELVELPEIDGVPQRVYWHTGDWMRRAVERILETDFEFVPARTALEASEGSVQGDEAGDQEPRDR